MVGGKTLDRKLFTKKNKTTKKAPPQKKTKKTEV